ncbi:hypothetical protein RCC89_11085 [Cytophagaceae bacterium ABcell3]|nr:hypothetical protein RCC89_11085 [Cytophagaceae bacterium ABcell3]
MEQHREKIEHYGVIMEGMGLSPVAARVFVYLLLSPNQLVTFDDLVNYFNVSKSAISNAIKWLTTSQMIEAKTIGGQRKRYFSADFKVFYNEQQMSQKFSLMHTLLDDVRATRGLDDEFGKELDNISTLYKMLMVEIPIIIERWKRMTDFDKEK